MLPLTADSIFWAIDVSGSAAVRTVAGGEVRCSAFVSDSPSPSADSILSCLWPCVCTAAISLTSSSL